MLRLRAREALSWRILFKRLCHAAKGSSVRAAGRAKNIPRTSP